MIVPGFLVRERKPWREIAHVLTEKKRALSCMRPMGRPRGPVSGVTPHAEVVFGGDVHRGTELGPIRRPVRVVTDHTGDGPKFPVPLLQIVGGFTEGHFQGSLTFVTGHA